MDDDPLETVKELNEMFPLQFGSGDLRGLGNFILNLLQNPGDPEADAENIAIAMMRSMHEMRINMES